MDILKFFNPLFLYRIRKIVLPYVLRPLSSRGITVTENERRLAALKDRHKGQRCFVVGNGPSLKISDLDRLTNEVTFSCNKIYLAFDQTAWRPSYYVAEDILFVQQNYKTIEGLHGFTKIFPYYLKKYVPSFSDSYYFNYAYQDFAVSLPRFSFNLLDQLYGGATVTYTLLQLACYLGIREIYLLGVDLDYKVPAHNNGKFKNTNIIAAQGERNHFHPDYHRPGETWFEPDLHAHRNAFLAARQAMEKVGGSIKNASRGGKLDVFERVDFDALIDNGKNLI